MVKCSIYVAPYEPDHSCIVTRANQSDKKMDSISVKIFLRQEALRGTSKYHNVVLLIVLIQKNHLFNVLSSKMKRLKYMTNKGDIQQTPNT